MISALVAEAGLELALEENCKDLHVFSDSLTLVQVIHSTESHNEFHAILGDIRELSTMFSTISFGFIPRSSNLEADTLAKHALHACDVVIPRS